MLGHLRSECYPMYGKSFYPPGRGARPEALSIEGADGATAEVKRQLGYL